MVRIKNILITTIAFMLLTACNDPIDAYLLKHHGDILKKAEEALEYCEDNNLNEDICILIDMSMHSGVKRFHVFDLKSKKVIARYLVSHGCGENGWSLTDSKNRPQFSNTPDSHLSSLGKYRIGKRGYSNWGVNINYRLHGLDSTNSNAYDRDIVFHSWHAISDEQVFPEGTPEGWGCPAISDRAFLQVDKLLKDERKPVLMWIFN